MHAFLIRNEEDYARAIELVDALWDSVPGTPEHHTLDVMAELIDRYESAHRDLPAPDPIALIRFKLKELRWSQRELGRRLEWPAGRVSEVLGGKRALTLRMVQDLARVLELPPGLLVPGAQAHTPAEVDVIEAPLVRKLREAAASVGQSVESFVDFCVHQAQELRPVVRLTVVSTSSATAGPLMLACSSASSDMGWSPYASDKAAA